MERKQGMRMFEIHKVDVMETKFVRSMCGVTGMDRCTKEDVERRVGV